MNLIGYLVTHLPTKISNVNVVFLLNQYYEFKHTSVHELIPNTDREN